IVLLRTDLFNTLPFNNAYGAIVTAMDTSNVDTVFVAGKAVKRAGKLVDVDLASVRRQAAASRACVVGRLGWPRSVIDTSLSGHWGGRLQTASGCSVNRAFSPDDCQRLAEN